MSEKENIEDVVTFKKGTLWKLALGILAILLIVSIFTGGFKGSSSSDGSGSSGGSGSSEVDLSAFMSDESLYPFLGSKDADTTVIEFSDFQCPYCAMASGLPSWIDDYKSRFGDLIGSAQKVKQLAIDGKLRFIYVPMSFLGKESVYAAQAALCANEQGKFWEMHDAIFKAHDSSEGTGKYEKNKLKILAEGIKGLNFNAFADCLDNDKTLEAVYLAANEASKAASGTPTFYVNGKKYPGSWQQLSSAIGA
ncbi:DsbA family protein [Candidatus Pacearchaeota archaeon]|nr:DsbA family protein [Candidatus Pacearchaeota archaeon]